MIYYHNCYSEETVCLRDGRMVVSPVIDLILYGP